MQAPRGCNAVVKQSTPLFVCACVLFWSRHFGLVSIATHTWALAKDVSSVLCDRVCSACQFMRRQLSTPQLEEILKAKQYVNPDLGNAKDRIEWVGSFLEDVLERCPRLDKDEVSYCV